MTKQDLAELIVKKAESFLGEREIHGPNRSPFVDALNKYMRVPLGSPYCQSGAYFCADLVCKELGLINPLTKTAGTQVAWQKAPEKYKRQRAQKGDFAYWRSRKNKAQGHAGVVSKDQLSEPDFDTVEFNTDTLGSRDGGGVLRKKRQTFGTPTLEWLGFVDVAQWIIDANTPKLP